MFIIIMGVFGKKGKRRRGEKKNGEHKNKKKLKSKN